MFSQVCVCSPLGGGLPKSQVLSHVSVPRSFHEGYSRPGRGVHQSWAGSTTFPGGVPQSWLGVTPVLGGGTPVPAGGIPRLGYPLSRTGLGYPPARTGLLYPPPPTFSQDSKVRSRMLLPSETLRIDTRSYKIK